MKRKKNENKNLDSNMKVYKKGVNSKNNKGDIDIKKIKASNNKNKNRFVFAVKKNTIALLKLIPLFISIVLLINMIKVVIGYDFYKWLTTGNLLIDSFIYNTVGSILAGNAAISYYLASDMIKYGINLLLVVIFILAWVTVGFLQMPAESVLLGKKFAITRNSIAFITNIILAVVVVFLYYII